MIGFWRTIRAESTQRHIVTLAIDSSTNDSVFSDHTEDILKVFEASFGPSPSSELEYTIRDSLLGSERLRRDLPLEANTRMLPRNQDQHCNQDKHYNLIYLKHPFLSQVIMSANKMKWDDKAERDLLLAMLILPGAEKLSPAVPWEVVADRMGKMGHSVTQSATTTHWAKNLAPKMKELCAQISSGEDAAPAADPAPVVGKKRKAQQAAKDEPEPEPEPEPKPKLRKARQDTSSSYWVSTIKRQGEAPFADSGDKVFRNVKDYGAKGDGTT
ncbi:hypothetical protein GGR56DRAFT_697120 [Xylariaceae sp. FL0804]|nr:hypothetical protein GGR56DRAFT_697120 [Xylariaceae sp. FL0804]